MMRRERKKELHLEYSCLGSAKLARKIPKLAFLEEQMLTDKQRVGQALLGGEQGFPQYRFGENSLHEA